MYLYHGGRSDVGDMAERQPKEADDTTSVDEPIKTNEGPYMTKSSLGVSWLRRGL
jgi:hypothetical protein